MKTIRAIIGFSLLFALSGCAAMQGGGGGFGRPAQTRCSCGLSYGHSGAHASYRGTVSSLIEMQKERAEAQSAGNTYSAP
jgi:hypothetical protein